MATPLDKGELDLICRNKRLLVLHESRFKRNLLYSDMRTLPDFIEDKTFLYSFLKELLMLIFFVTSS